MSKFFTYEDYLRTLEEGPQEPVEDSSAFAIDFGKARLEGDRPSYTVTDFRNDPDTVKNFEVVMEYLSKNSGFLNATDLATSRNDDDPVEFLRDDVSRINTAVNKAMAFEDAPEEVKAAYKQLRQRFDEAEVYGLGEQLNRVKDYGVDLIANYENAAFAGAALLGGATTGGAGTVAAFLSRAGASKAAAQALKASTKLGEATQAASKAVTSPKGIAAYTGAYSLASDVASQELEIATDLRKELDPVQTVVATTIGTAFGFGLGKLGSKLATKKQIEDLSVEVPSRKDMIEVEVELPSGATVVVAADSKEFLEKSIRELFQQDAEEEFRKGMVDLLSDTADDLDKLVPKTAEEEFKEGLVDLLDGVIGDLDSLIRNKGDELVPEDLEGVPGLEQLVARLGGGQQTYEELVDAALAASRKGDQQMIQSDLLYNLHRGLSTFTSKYMFGKAGGFLSPYAEVSPTAKLLREKTSTEFALALDYRGKPQKLVEEDFAESQRNITGAFYKEYIKAVLPLAAKKFNVTLTDEINDALSLALRGQASEGKGYSKEVNRAAMNIKKVYMVAGEALKREGFITDLVDDYVPRQWKRSAIENPRNRDKLARLLIEEGEAKGAKEAAQIIEEMLDKNNQLFMGRGDYFFVKNRAFQNIKNDFKFEEFLNTDVQQTFFNYMTQAGMGLAKKKTFGVKSLKEFNEKWIVPIQREVEAGGGEWSRGQTERLKDLYVSLTGEGAEVAGKANQLWQLTQRMALLPLATLSSLTEVLLNFGVAGGATIDGFKAAWKISGAKNKADIDDFLNAHEVGFKLMTEDTHKRLVDDLGLTPDEAWHEMQEFGLIMEQQLSSMSDRLAGDMVSNEAMQKASNGFFRVTLLDQWTKFVQNVSFQTGKKLINNHIDDIVNHGSAPLTRRMQSKLDDLAEFGVDVEKAKQWVQAGKNVEDPFYKDILRGAARYTNQIILQPTRASGLKPRFHSTPFGSMLYQLMGYPTAFTNNILKRGAKRLIRDKEIAAEKLVPTALLMTAVAGATNYARTRGEGYEDKSAMQIGWESIARWGGNGILFDQMYRSVNNVQYLGTPGLAVGLFGPTVSDFATAVGSRKPIRTLGQKVPGYGLGKPLFGEEAMKEYKETLSDIDEALLESLMPEKETKLFAKGGEVKDVPQAAEEPDERVDKMTGRPYNEQAGTAFQDEEERSLLGRTS